MSIRMIDRQTIKAANSWLSYKKIKSSGTCHWPSKLTIVSFYWLQSAPPILFYNIVDTVSVTLDQCTFIFYLVACVSAYLNNLTFDIFNIPLHHGNGFYNSACVLFQFWYLYFCWNTRWQLLVYWCYWHVLYAALEFSVFIAVLAL